MTEDKTKLGNLFEVDPFILLPVFLFYHIFSFVPNFTKKYRLNTDVKFDDGSGGLTTSPPWLTAAAVGQSPGSG